MGDHRSEGCHDGTDNCEMEEGMEDMGFDFSHDCPVWLQALKDKKV